MMTLIWVSKVLSTISVYDNYISHSVNQIWSCHSCLAILGSPRFPDGLPSGFASKHLVHMHRVSSGDHACCVGLRLGYCTISSTSSVTGHKWPWTEPMYKIVTVMDVINLHTLYAYSSHAFYFLPHDHSYDFIFLISLSMLIFTIAYLHSNGILLDLHHPLWRHTHCSY